MNGMLSNEEMTDVLLQESFGHLGCCDNAIPYVVPMAFAYHDNVIYGQTKEGRKIAILRKNPHVCFQVQSQQGNVWRSVLCHGMFQELAVSELTHRGEIQAVQSLSAHLGKAQGQVGVGVGFSFAGTPEPLAMDGRTSTLFRIVISEKTGRFYVREE